MEEIQKKIFEAQAELSTKKELEIQRFLNQKGFKDIFDLRNKGFDLLIEKKEFNNNRSLDKYIISEQIILKLVKIIDVEFVDCNIKINL